jgi:hypothetical protein
MILDGGVSVPGDAGMPLVMMPLVVMPVVMTLQSVARCHGLLNLDTKRGVG